MKKLHVFDIWQRPIAGMLKDQLENEGVACLLRNDQLSTAMGDIPFIECYPELWVIDDETYPRARMLLDSWLTRQESDKEPWTCPFCGEVSEGQFYLCWRCENQRQ
ncbi:DUF2007 domain-containing protein [Geopsychrobacter electrodiphilus]|uniref:putative signal transducing protein n=1 Tax=Geopsychrobacter electrodiphilus TaxID=225196 RepID=UPI000367EDAB|nr:DUF2007 domain-containing protein [Geopsychrobacter electrodiphilus]